MIARDNSGYSSQVDIALDKSLNIAPVTPTIGAEISGIDLAQTLEQDAEDQIYDALMKHLVLFFRDQDLSPQAQFEFATEFGTPVGPHPD